MKKLSNIILIDKEDVTSPIVDHYSEYSSSGGDNRSNLSKLYNLSKNSDPIYRNILNDPKKFNRGTWFIKNSYTDELEKKLFQTNLYATKTFDLKSIQNFYNFKINSPVWRATKAYYDLVLLNKNNPLFPLSPLVVPEASTNITTYLITSLALCATAGAALYLYTSKDIQLTNVQDKLSVCEEIIKIKDKTIEELSKTISILEEDNINNISDWLIDPTSTLLGTTFGLLIKIIVRK